MSVGRDVDHADRHGRPRRARGGLRLVRWFLLGGVRFDAKAVGLDGALTKLLRADHGPWLLGLVAAGLIAFGVYSLSEARYRRI
jgi:hypothetical protein